MKNDVQKATERLETNQFSLSGGGYSYPTGHEDL
jgi:hypothetical protein